MDMNTFYDLDKKAIGMFMTGVAWTKPERIRLGSYDEHIEPGYIYDNNNKRIATFDKGVVSNLDGRIIGEYKDKSIYIDGKKLGVTLQTTSLRQLQSLYCLESYEFNVP